jgi:hypothetical protein
MLRSSDSLPAAKGKGRTSPRARRKARAVLDRPPLQGWRTTDEDEVALRRWRGLTEIFAVEPIEPEQPIFGRSACAPVAVASTRWKSAASRASPIPVAVSTIEPMALGRASTSRACWRHCGKAADARSAWRPIEAIRASRCSLTAAVAPRSLAWSVGGRTAGGARRFLAPFFGSDGTLARDPKKIEALISAWRVAPASVRRQVRVSRHFAP